MKGPPVWYVLALRRKRPLLTRESVPSAQSRVWEAHMNSQSKAESSACLQALKEAFGLFREGERGATRIPASLRRMAVDGVRQCESVVSVSRACGVTPPTIRKWVLEIPPAPRRLAIVNNATGALPDSGPEPLETKSPALNELPAAPEPFRFRLAAGVALDATPEQALWLVRQLGDRP